MRPQMLARFVLIMSALGLFASGCATRSKPMDGFSNGYEKITLARAGGPDAEAEVIRPEYITEVKKGASVVTAVHIYTPRRAQQARLLEAQIGELRRMSSKVPGLVSFNLHKGSGGRVINYVQFESWETYKAWRASAAYRELLDASQPFLSSQDADTYEVVYIQQ